MDSKTNDNSQPLFSSTLEERKKKAIKEDVKKARQSFETVREELNIPPQ